MTLEQARQDFAKLQKKITTMKHAIDLLFFDGETVAPPKATANRINTLEIINDELYRLKFCQETADLAAFLKEHESELSLVEKRCLTLLKTETDRVSVIPKDEYVKYQTLLISAQEAWHSANEEDEYDIFRPYLEKVFNKVREFAVAANPNMDPYDYCLNKHEPGSNQKVYDEVFDGIRTDIVPLLMAIKEKPPVDDSCLKGDYSVDKQKDLAIYIMELLGLNMSNIGLGTSEHPFTRRIGSHFDERITTRYSRRDFTFSLYTILFGCGYALAETGQSDEVVYTLADGSASFGIMEGQTRFYENIIGRSKAFIECIYPKLKALFPTSIRDSSPEDLYYAVNKVHAGPIRIGSDEITNSLHVLVRYELERDLLNKSLSFDDLPDAWAEKYMKYLGVEVPDYTHGVLQDFLWADAFIGYFPTAVLGNAYSSVMLGKMSEDLDVEACVREGKFEVINQWNREHVWQHIALYDSHTVMEKFVGVPSINSDIFTKYLRYKYSEIYNL